MRKPIVTYVAAYGAYVAALHAVDGPWRRWSKGEVVDPWTLTHVAWSIIAQRMGIPLKQLMFLAVANEVGEWVLRRRAQHLLFGTPESPLNAAADVAANYLGYRAAEALFT